MTSPSHPTESSRATERPLRSDAQRTRRLVLDAANRLFAERGLDVGFKDIAQEAGVGVGTVYRRFPDRDTLLEALFAEKIEQLIDSARAALDIEDPWLALVGFCEQGILAQHRDLGLIQVLARSDLDRTHLTTLRHEADLRVETLVRRAQEAGRVRPDLTPAELAVSMHLLSRIAAVQDSDLWRRSLAIYLDGIRHRPDQDPLPGTGPGFDESEQVIARL